MKKLLHIFRAGEWWEYKLCPLLALGYGGSLLSGSTLLSFAPRLLLIILSVMIGAVYVSVINDITDLSEDLAAGKKNRMAALPVLYHWLIPLACVAAGTGFLIFFFESTLSRLLYLLPWIAFSVYSFPPVRLKKYGFWGVCADACGAHLFISLLMVSECAAFSGKAPETIWFLSTGVWSFCYGLRGILWHQFFDRENDRKSHVSTFATRIDPASFASTAAALFLVEIVAFGMMMIRLSLPSLMLALPAYLLLVFIRFRKWQHRVVLVLSPPHGPYQIAGVDFYQFFFPVAVLTGIALSQPGAWIVLLIHLLLFHATLRKVVSDLRSWVGPLTFQ